MNRLPNFSSSHWNWQPKPLLRASEGCYRRWRWTCTWTWSCIWCGRSWMRGEEVLLQVKHPEPHPGVEEKAPWWGAVRHQSAPPVAGHIWWWWGVFKGQETSCYGAWMRPLAVHCLKRKPPDQRIPLKGSWEGKEVGCVVSSCSEKEIEI